MKRLLLALAAGVLASVSLSAIASPFLPVDRAASIAQRDLHDRGLDGKVYIDSVAISKSSAVGADRYWYARWSEAVPGDNDKKQIGLRINMDGSTLSVVEGPGGVNELLKDYRLRADRPSILMLKH